MSQRSKKISADLAGARMLVVKGVVMLPGSSAGIKKEVLQNSSRAGWLLYFLGSLTGLLLAGATMDFYIEDYPSDHAVQSSDEKNNKGYNESVIEEVIKDQEKRHTQVVLSVYEGAVLEVASSVSKGHDSSTHCIWETPLGAEAQNITSSIINAVVRKLRKDGFNSRVSDGFLNGGRCVVTNLKY